MPQVRSNRAAALLVLLFCMAAIGVFLTSATAVYVREVTLRTQERARAIAREAAEGEMARAMYDLDRLPDGPSRRVLQPARPVEGGTLVASYEVVEGRTESTGMLVPLLARASFTTPRGFVASWAIWATVSRAPDGRGVAQTWEEGEGLAD